MNNSIEITNAISLFHVQSEELDLFNGNLFELDLSQLRRTVQSLKECVLKAEDKVIYFFFFFCCKF